VPRDKKYLLGKGKKGRFFGQRQKAKKKLTRKLISRVDWEGGEGARKGL